MELEAEGSRLENAITVEEASLTHFDREVITYYLESFRGGDPDSVPFQRKVIDSLVNAVWLWDDRLRIAFNFSGKGSTVERDYIVDAAEIAGEEGSYNAFCAPP